MNNDWTTHQLKAAEYAQRAAFHYKIAAEFNAMGNIEKAIQNARLAVINIDNSISQARHANEYCFKSIIDDMLEC